jgi:hypothetical protein
MRLLVGIRELDTPRKMRPIHCINVYNWEGERGQRTVLTYTLTYGQPYRRYIPANPRDPTLLLRGAISYRLQGCEQAGGQAGKPVRACCVSTHLT